MVEHCQFHEAAKELYEIVEALTCLTEQRERHIQPCRCLHCRAIRALAKARRTSADSTRVAIAGVGGLQGATKGK